MAGTMQGTRSSTRTPAASTAATFSGLFDNSRILFNPKYWRISQVGFKAQALVGLHGVGAFILQFVGAQLVQQADAAPLLMLVDQQSAALFGDHVQRQFKLCAAIAAQAVENVAREALRVNAHQRRQRTVRHIAHLQHDGFFQAVIEAAFKSVDSKVSKPGWEIRFGSLVQPERGRSVHELSAGCRDAFIIMICELPWRIPPWSRCW